MTTYTPTNSHDLDFAPCLYRTKTGWAIAVNRSEEPNLEFTTRDEAFDAYRLLEDRYGIERNDDGTFAATVKDNGQVVDFQLFDRIGHAAQWVDDHFEAEYTRPIVRYHLTDVALRAISDLY